VKALSSNSSTAKKKKKKKEYRAKEDFIGKGIHEKPISKIIFNSERLKTIPPKSGIRHNTIHHFYSTFPLKSYQKE
jgi:hypothetical protein